MFLWTFFVAITQNWFNIVMISIILYLIRLAFFVGTFTKLKRDLKGKTIIVTGASAGIGKETALKLLEDGAEVIFACRDKEKTMNLFKQIEKKNKEHSTRAHFIELDLVSFKSVKKFIGEFEKKFLKLDILINNAALFPIKFEITDDGLESNYQQNYFSLVLMTMLLLYKFDKVEGRIINVSSFAHCQCDLSPEVIQNWRNEKGFKSIEKKYFDNVWLKHYHYANTKTAGIYFTSFLSTYLNKNYPQIKTACANPGLVYTEFARFMYGHGFLGTLYHYFYWVYVYIAKPAISGAQTSLHLCYEDFNNILNGSYYSDCKLGKPSVLSKSVDVRDAIIDYTFDVLKERKLLNEINY